MNGTSSIDVRVPFVGRKEELRRLLRLFEGGGALTLVGPGGVGKSRLAIEAIERWPERERFGATFVPLAGVAAEAVAGSIAAALQAQPRSPADAAEAIAEAAGERSRVLVLDSCENAIEVVRPIVERLRATRGVAVLATSRARLGLASESLLAVEPFDARDGCLFFAARARNANVDVDLDGSDAPFVHRIVASLDGLAIALDLAAARLASRNVRELADELADPRPYYFRSSASSEPRHWSLNHVVDWSVQKLSEGARRAFAFASRFARTFDAEDVAALTGDSVAETAQSLAALEAQSLVLAAAQAYAMLAPIRTVARRHLAELPDRRSADERFAARMEAVARGIEREGGSPGSAGTLAAVSARYDDLCAALAWALKAPARRLEQVVGTFLALVGVWSDGGRFCEGLSWCDRVVEAAEAIDIVARGRLYYGAIVVAHAAGEYDRILALAPPLITTFTIAGDRLGLARAYNALGVASLSASRAGAAETYCRTALALYQAIGHARGVATANINLGNVAQEARSEPAIARDFYERALATLLEGGWDALVAIAYGNLADVSIDLRDPAAAERYARLALGTLSETGNAANAAWQHVTIARARIERGDAAGARAELARAFELLERQPQPEYLANAAQTAARVLCDRRDYLAAAELAYFVKRFREQRRAPAKGGMLAEARALEARIDRQLERNERLEASARARTFELRALADRARRAIEGAELA
ncbi:MAG TPA: AAA family ATPase [Verrucomicrobiae bacterium]|nr:AAA family ATPase [Verrucomicrobiae bacterium]